MRTTTKMLLLSLLIACAVFAQPSPSNATIIDGSTLCRADGSVASCYRTRPVTLSSSA
jgi:hypothetical protein